jgi:N utilization substance protein B
MRRRLARQVALQALFQVDLLDGPLATALAFAGELAGLDAPSLEFAQELAVGVMSARDRLDERLAAHASGWSVRRMAVVDRNILRLGCYELLEKPGLGPGIVINEAVELAKRFGSIESSRFVNGILGSIAKETAPRPE